ncbi:MAG: PEP-CTERM sorting domain-containing protein [Planctomycetes bacterium]|nr:PEP-CTERM sorting domain-containing protein [Planctomycetota bacterium]
MNRTQVVAFFVVASVALSTYAAPVQWRLSDGGNGHFYEIMPDQTLSWTAAGSTAQAAGGYLATITSQAEQTFIENIFDSGPTGSGGYWFGLNDSLLEGDFRWVTDEPLAYTNWNSGEPNNAGDEDYGQFLWTATPDEFTYYRRGKWNDAPQPGWTPPRDYPDLGRGGYVIELDGGTVAHWQFEEGTPGALATGVGSIIDSVGGHHGTPYGTTGPVYRSASTFDGGAVGLEFNQTSERVFVPDSIDLALTESLTLEAFVIRDPGPARYSYILFRGDDREATDPYVLGVLSNGQVYFSVTSDGSHMSQITSPVSLPESKLVHLAAVLDDATGEQKLYFDGVLVASTITNIRPFAELDPTRNPGLGIGNTQSDSWLKAFDGVIADVRISNIALTPDQFFLCPLYGDLDKDNDVDIYDWVIFQVNFGTASGMAWEDGDFDGDGDVDVFDWTLFQPNYGTSRAWGISIPEPATLSLLTLASMALIRRRHRA